MDVSEIDAKIELLKRKMQTTKSHIAKIEMQRQLGELEEQRVKASTKQSWEM